ncbi:MAG: O-antigen ligase family protein [Chloroflexota bacterium]|nr:O-antigen ligase family protein [Chloroflexota bacterium]
MPEQARRSSAPPTVWPGFRFRALDSATWAIGGGLILVAIYATLRTLAVPEVVLLAWAALAVVLTIASPLAGLTILAAIGPFTEALTDDARITAVPFVLAALGLGTLVALARLAVARQLPRVPLPVALAVVLFIGTLSAVGLSALWYGPQRGLEALQLWVPGIGGGLTVLFAAWLIGREGEYRPLAVVVGSITLAASLSVVDVLLNGVIRESAFGWLLRSEVGPERLTGVIPAPNAAATIFLVALGPAAAAVLFAAHPRLRLLALIASAILLTAILLTYSRSALLALVIIAVLLAWRFRGWRALAGVAAAVLAIGIAVLAIPRLGVLREVPFWADEARLGAWSASIRMWLDAPLTGHGFRSFEWLHLQYGSTLDAPHNEWLRFFAEGGVAVGIAALAVVLSGLLATLRGRDWLAGAGAAGLTAVALMAAFNNPFLYAQVTVAAFLVVGGASAAVPYGHATVPPGRSVTERPTRREADRTL